MPPPSTGSGHHLRPFSSFQSAAQRGILVDRRPNKTPSSSGSLYIPIWKHSEGETTPSPPPSTQVQPCSHYHWRVPNSTIWSTLFHCVPDRDISITLWTISNLAVSSVPHPPAHTSSSLYRSLFLLWPAHTCSPTPAILTSSPGTSPLLILFHSRSAVSGVVTPRSAASCLNPLSKVRR
ncbi:hypothetical protein GW17_00055637 [Ensete ventricosum]|nr:hypothetical protein GW17_00055637 [Ensete ventricosum]